MIDNPDLCIVRLGKHEPDPADKGRYNSQSSAMAERIKPELAGELDPVDPATFHEYVLPAHVPVELHRHDFDEYWWFVKGSPVITLWTEKAGLREYRLQPGDMVACLRGVAHTLRSDETLVYHQFSSVRRPGAREGHQPVEL
jgi:mannose-6-phosphate isomerase-like protein (cupin superfamily)